MIPMTTDEFLLIMAFNALLAICAIWLGIKYLKESEEGDGE